MCSRVSLTIQSDVKLEHVTTAAVAAGITIEPDIRAVEQRVLLADGYYSSWSAGTI